MTPALTALTDVLPECILRWLVCVIYIYPLDRRQRFGLGAVAWLVGQLLLEWGLALAVSFSLAAYLWPLALLAVGWLMGLSCTTAKPGVALYFAIWSCCTGSLLYEIWQMLCQYLPGLQAETSLAQLGLLFLLTGTVCALLGLTVDRWLPVYESQHVGPRQLTSAILLYLLFGGLWTAVYQGGELNPQGTIGVLFLLCEIYCLTILYLQTSLFQKSAIRHELETMNLMWHQQAAQYQLSRENIALINRKCHDLKHQVAAMRTMEGSEQRERYIREIEDSVRIYDAAVRTNNETLDTVLTEKSLLCEANEISINCVADGSSLGFMDPVDLYTVMGNALDNAIEAVRKCESKELRVIDVLVHVRQRFLVISVTNPLQEKLAFRDGLPVSVKPQNGYHGYGMKSIRHTARKYGGEMTVSTEGGCFSLRITIPLPQETASK
ncbi:MAG: ATP-binding protein [Clostridiales bacterium]|nr:ATP-binding protein [Clostridiales bacterium]